MTTMMISFTAEKIQVCPGKNSGMRDILQIFSKSTLKNMALKVVHYALIALAVALGLAVLYWRWRRVNNQNKALEAELRLIQPYNNMAPLPDIMQMTPLTATSSDTAKPPAAAETPAKALSTGPPAGPPVMGPPVMGPPVITPPVLSVIHEQEDSEDEDDDPAVGAPPTLEHREPVDPMFVDFVSVMSMMPSTVLHQTLEGNIVELPDDPKDAADESKIEQIEPVVAEPAEPVALEDKPVPARATGARRRRK
jgi:hypothetical protein